MVHQRSGCACALVIDTVGVVFFATTVKRRCAGQGCHIVEADTVIVDLKVYSAGCWPEGAVKNVCNGWVGKVHDGRHIGEDVLISKCQQNERETQ